jgi:hypothetical protein
MEFLGFFWFVIFSHEILVLNDTWMDKVLSNTKLTIHLLKTLVRQLLIVINFTELVHKFSAELLYLNLEYLCLCSNSKLFLHGNIEALKRLLQRTIEHLNIFRLVNELHGCLESLLVVLLLFLKHLIYNFDCVWLIKHGYVGTVLTDHVIVIN